MLDKRSADRGLMSVPFLRLQVRVNIIREKDPFDKLVCLCLTQQAAPGGQADASAGLPTL